MNSPDIDALLAEIREHVRLRRIAGDYPPGLEQELEAEFRGVVDRERRDWTSIQTKLREQTEGLARSLDNITGTTDIQSRIPGGAFFHRVVRRIIGRQTRGLAAQFRHAAEEMAVLITTVSESQQAQEDADRRLVMHLSKAVMERLAVVDHLAIIVRDLERRLES